MNFLIAFLFFSEDKVCLKIARLHQWI